MEDLKDDVSFSKGSFVGFQLVVLGEIGSWMTNFSKKYRISTVDCINVWQIYFHRLLKINPQLKTWYDMYRYNQLYLCSDVCICTYAMFSYVLIQTKHIPVILHSWIHIPDEDTSLPSFASALPQIHHLYGKATAQLLFTPTVTHKDLTTGVVSWWGEWGNINFEEKFVEKTCEHSPIMMGKW